MHTASVLTLGLVLFVLARTFPPDRVYPWLTLATGLVALGLGAALFVSRARRLRRAEPAGHGHTHPWDEPPTSAAFPRPLHVGHPRPGLEAGRAAASAVLLLEREDASAAGNQDEERSQGHDLERGHRDDHDHDHRHDHQAARPLSRRGLVALAVAGGILPSPTAFVVLTGAVSAHRIGYGLALIAAFSAGLAASLMIVGMIAVRARVAVARRLGSRLAAILPVISALVIAGFGVFFSVQGLAVL